MAQIKKNDFIELEFTGRVKNGEIFDTNIKDEARKINLEIDSRPLIICIGQNMILPSIDEFLEGKDTGKYSLELTPEKAFGTRSSEMIKTMPLRIFLDKNIIPERGHVFQFDNLLGRVSAVSGGRVIVDFNNPLAGKEVVYELNIKRILAGLEEKVETLISLYFRRKLEFELKDSNLKIKVEKQFAPLASYFKDKFKEILGLELEVIELEQKKEDASPPEASEAKKAP